MKDLFGNENESGAIFSPCGRYRYALWRVWDNSLPMVTFIGLNPSTANQDQDDPTIRRVKAFAKDWGFGGINMVNLFGIISPYPEILTTDPNPVGVENDRWIKTKVEESEKVIFAWGNFKEADERAKSVIAQIPDAFCLKRNKNGSPGHPLYIPANTILTKFMEARQ